MQQPDGKQDAQHAQVRSDPVEVLNRLGNFDLTPEILVEAVNTGMQHAFLCTKHDPPNLPGILVWGKSVRHLRDELVRDGWEARNTQNYATVVHPSAKLAIAVAAGDSATGKPELMPSTRHSKGPVTRRKVAENMTQLTFSLILAEVAASFPAPQQVAGVQTWYLLHCADEYAKEIRVEFSLPLQMGDDGHINQWRERLILPSIPLGSDSLPEHDEDAGPDIDIRRQSA